MAIDRQTRPDHIFGGLERAEYERLGRELAGYCCRVLGSPFDGSARVPISFEAEPRP